jgi:hypothetical protein
MAESNAELALKSRLGSRAGYGRRLEALRDALDLDELPSRMECFDISHTQGELTVASCVVFDGDGPRKSDYRRFNIDGIGPGDDYAAMEQALSRRYRRIQKGEVPLPDLLFIDGGKGQLGAVEGVLQELGITGVQLVGVAKGPDRKAGAEQLWLPGRKTPILPAADSPASHLVQQIRDEAHRFAITGHRQRRDKARRPRCWKRSRASARRSVRTCSRPLVVCVVSSAPRPRTLRGSTASAASLARQIHAAVGEKWNLSLRFEVGSARGSLRGEGGRVVSCPWPSALGP